MKKIDLLCDGIHKYLFPEVQYHTTWAVAHHMRFLIFANTIKMSKAKTVLDIGAGEGTLCALS